MMSDDELLAKFLAENKKVGVKNKSEKPKLIKNREKLNNKPDFFLQKFLDLQEDSVLPPTLFFTLIELFNFVNILLEKMDNKNRPKLKELIRWSQYAIYDQDLQQLIDYISEIKETNNIKKETILYSVLDVMTALSKFYLKGAV